MGLARLTEVKSFSADVPHGPAKMLQGAKKVPGWNFYENFTISAVYRPVGVAK